MLDVTLDLSKPDDLQLYLFASLTATGSTEATGSIFVRACRWYSSLVGQGLTHIPFFLAHDLGLLLLKGRRFPFRIMQGKTDSDPARETYETQVLGRIVAGHAFQECHDIVDEMQCDDLISWLLELLVTPLKDSELPRMMVAAHAIRQTPPPGSIGPQQAKDRFLEKYPEAPDLFSEMCHELANIYSVVPINSLLSTEDIRVARHFNLLSDRASRLSARQVAGLEKVVGKSSPPPRHWVRETRVVSVNQEDAGYYPQGGLDEIATRGSVENLVRSELVYLEDTKGPDLFSLRFVEGELLYYTRDEGQLMRRSRGIHVFLDLKEEHFFRYPGQPARLSSIMEAVVNTAVESMFEVFDGDSLKVSLHGPSSKTQRSLPEAWRIRFTDRMDRGDVDVSNGYTAPDFNDPELPMKNRMTTVLYVGPKRPPTEKMRDRAEREGVGVVWLQIVDKDAGEEESNPKPDDWSFHLPSTGKDIIARVSDVQKRVVWALYAT
jgi:hypothetical protein